MKKINLFGLLIIGVMAFYSCGDDTENEQNDDKTENAFERNGDALLTPHAYLVFSPVLQYDIETQMDVIKYRDRVTLILIDDEITLDDNSDLVYGKNATTLASISLLNINDGSVKETAEDVTIPVKTYDMSSGSTFVVNGSVDVNYTDATGSYGELNGYYIPLSNEDIATLAVSALSLDFDKLSGSISVTYNLSPGIDGTINGNYSGAISIIK